MNKQFKKCLLKHQLVLLNPDWNENPFWFHLNQKDCNVKRDSA